MQNKTNCCSMNRGFVLRCYGRLIHTVIAGWDQSEYHNVFAAITGACKISQALGTVLQDAPGNRQTSPILGVPRLIIIIIEYLTEGENSHFQLVKYF